MARTSFCHCFSNQEDLAQGTASTRTYLAFCVVTGREGAIEFSFQTTYIDQSKEPPFATFYGVSSEWEEDADSPKKLRIHSRSPLTDDGQTPCEKPFLRSQDLFYSYTVNLDLHKLKAYQKNPDTYLTTIHSKVLYEELKAVYTGIFKTAPVDTEHDHFMLLVD